MFGEDLYIDPKEITAIRLIDQNNYEIRLKNKDIITVNWLKNNLQFMEVKKYMENKYKDELKWLALMMVKKRKKN